VEPADLPTPHYHDVATVLIMTKVMMFIGYDGTKL